MQGRKLLRWLESSGTFVGVGIAVLHLQCENVSYGRKSGELEFRIIQA